MRRIIAVDSTTSFKMVRSQKAATACAPLWARGRIRVRCEKGKTLAEVV